MKICLNIRKINHINKSLKGLKVSYFNVPTNPLIIVFWIMEDLGCFGDYGLIDEEIDFFNY
jgi:hypothetical protein